MNNPNIKDVISDMIDQGFRIGKKPKKEDEVNENNLHVNFKLAEEINNMADFVLFHPEKNALIELYTNENDELVRGNAVANISFSSMSNNVEDLMKKIENTTPPTMALEAQDITIECSDSENGALEDWLDANGMATAMDNCGDVTWTNDYDGSTADCTTPVLVTFTATDDCGNSTTTAASYTIIDSVPPTIDNEASDLTMECEDYMGLFNSDGEGTQIGLQEWLDSNGGATASDSCGTVTWTNDFTDISDECGNTGSATVTFTATDACGNASSTTATFTVVDTSAPTVTTDFEEEIFVNCTDVPDAPELEFEDACSTDISVAFNESDTFDGVNDYEVYYEWTVSDECGNTAIYLQTIFVTLESNVTGQDMSLCVEDSPVDLFDQLSGDYNPNGVWTVTLGDATLENGSIFDPSTVEVGDYEFTYEDNDPVCPSETTVAIIVHDECVVLPCGAEDVVISKAVTANGDQYNEFFTVTGVEGCGYTIDVQIYNRWGSLIFEANNYQNNWNGDAHGNAVGSSNKVPTGTYYYIVKLIGSGLKPFSGPIYVGTK